MQVVEPGADRFWTLDLSVGYRLPRRYGVASLEVLNAFDNAFRFQDSSADEPTIVPSRQILARVTLAF